MSDSTTVLEAANAFQKDFGKEVLSWGGDYVNYERLPTGIFPLDLALGGGFPRGKCTMVFGVESSNKTNIVLLVIANFQRKYPHLVCIFIDVENSFDPIWAEKLGVNTKKLLVVAPSHAEQAIDMIEGFLMSDDCGLVCVDSLAAFVTKAETERDAETANVGGAGVAIGKLYRKSTLAMVHANKKGNFPTLFYINQIRSNVGQQRGNPETTPGGKAPWFQASIVLRVYGKNVTDPKISKVMPVIKETSFILKKWKCPVLSASGKADVVMLPFSYFKTGDTNDFGTIKSYLEGFDAWKPAEKPLKGWDILGEVYGKQEDFRDKIFGDRVFGQEVRSAIIARCLEDGGFLPEKNFE